MFGPLVKPIGEWYCKFNASDRSQSCPSPRAIAAIPVRAIAVLKQAWAIALSAILFDWGDHSAGKSSIKPVFCLK
ncbi:MAG: hypothetical protein HC852_22825 [Acaryochloridaceae cyanobacterium RU_4_10]|nr:hypothetical protein [Acaryochloridaceae cyanobacterium RU_4_10]